MRYLRTNTAIRLTVGPFLDKTDGVTPEVALTVTSCKLTLMVDDANVPTLVLDVAPTASAGANDMVHVTGDDAGFYDLELAAANVNYLGRAMLAITDAATHCPVFHEFMILPANIYDSLVLGTDLVDVSVTQWLGTAAATPTVAGVPEVDVTHVAGATTNVAALATNVDAILTDTADMQPKLGTPAGASISADILVIDNFVDGLETTIGAAGAGLTALATQASVNTIDDFLDTEVAALTTELAKVPKSDSTVTWNATALASMQQEATDALNAYDPPTNTEMEARTIAAASYATATALDAVDNFLDIEIATLVGYGAPPTAASVADAVWDEDATAHQTGGTFGQAIGDPGADTNTIFKAVVTDATGATVGVDVVAVKAETVEILADTDDIGVAGAGLTALATQASVTAIDDLLDSEMPALTTAVADLPTNAELATALGTADDAILAAIAALNNLSATAAANAVGALVIEGAVTLIESLRLANAANAGKVSGAATSTVVLRNLADTLDRVTATTDADGNRTAVTTVLT